MSAGAQELILYSEAEIKERTKALARAIARGARRPQIVVPVLVGAFVFAADLMRALSREGLDLETEFIWLKSYGRSEEPGEVKVLKGPSDIVHGRTVLLIDGVLDLGGTLVRASEVLTEAGAAGIVSAVVVTKEHPRPMFRADHTLFTAGPEFLFGYGMDRSGRDRCHPDIRVRRK